MARTTVSAFWSGGRSTGSGRERWRRLEKTCARPRRPSAKVTTSLPTSSRPTSPGRPSTRTTGSRVRAGRSRRTGSLLALRSPAWPLATARRCTSEAHRPGSSTSGCPDPLDEGATGHRRAPALRGLAARVSAALCRGWGRVAEDARHRALGDAELVGDVDVRADALGEDVDVRSGDGPDHLTGPRRGPASYRGQGPAAGQMPAQTLWIIGGQPSRISQGAAARLGAEPHGCRRYPCRPREDSLAAAVAIVTTSLGQARPSGGARPAHRRR